MYIDNKRNNKDLELPESDIKNNESNVLRRRIVQLESELAETRAMIGNTVPTEHVIDIPQASLMSRCLDEFGSNLVHLSVATPLATCLALPSLTAYRIATKQIKTYSGAEALSRVAVSGLLSAFVTIAPGAIAASIGLLLECQSGTLSSKDLKKKLILIWTNTVMLYIVISISILLLSKYLDRL